MVTRIGVLAGLVMASASGAFAQPSSQTLTEPIVNVGVFGLRPDGRPSGSAVKTAHALGDTLSGVVYVAPCARLGATTDERIPASATEVWRLSGRLLSLDPQAASLELGWQRLRRNGTEEDSAPQSTVLTLSRGVRHRIETVDLPAIGSCDGLTAVLDVVFASREELYGPAPSSAPAGTARITRGSTGAGGVAVITTRDSQTPSGSAGGVFRGGGSGTAVGVGARGGPGPMLLFADLWLVQTIPGRPDTTQHITVPVQTTPTDFSFAPTDVVVDRGVLNVRIGGTIETGQTPSGQQQLYFSARRTSTLVPTGPGVRDQGRQTASSDGSTKTAVGLPGPDEVLSFELPALQNPDGGATVGRFAVRVRITPRPLGQAPPVR